MLSVDALARVIAHSILLPGQTGTDPVEGIAIARTFRVKCVLPKALQAARRPA